MLPSSRTVRATPQAYACADATVNRRHEALRELLVTMQQRRIRRRRNAGSMQTPNFM
jgi:hypothetical protein